MARPVMFSATARPMRSHAHVNEPLGFGGDSPGGRKRLGCECRHDRLAEERVLLTVAGAQFKAGRRAIEGADKGAVAGADHDPVLPHQFKDWGRFVAVAEAPQGHDVRERGCRERAVESGRTAVDTTRRGPSSSRRTSSGT